MRNKQNDPTTYARILHYAKFPRGRSWSDIRESSFQVLTVMMSIGGGNTTDDSIDYRELVAANQRGESS